MQTPSVFRSALLLSLLMLLLQGCDRWPADPRHSLDAAIDRGTLKVGVVANPPWVSVTNPDAPEGLESQLVTQFARELNMTVEWSTGGVEEQIEALKSFQLDLLIGGFTASNPWRADVGNTFPYYVERILIGSSEIELLKHKHVLLTPPGENALLMELEQFLFRNKDEQQLSTRLWQETQP